MNRKNYDDDKKRKKKFEILVAANKEKNAEYSADVTSKEKPTNIIMICDPFAKWIIWMDNQKRERKKRKL